MFLRVALNSSSQLSLTRSFWYSCLYVPSGMHHHPGSCSGKDWTQDFMDARWALYQLSYVPSSGLIYLLDSKTGGCQLCRQLDALTHWELMAIWSVSFSQWPQTSHWAMWESDFPNCVLLPGVGSHSQYPSPWEALREVCHKFKVASTTLSSKSTWATESDFVSINKQTNIDLTEFNNYILLPVVRA